MLKAVTEINFWHRSERLGEMENKMYVCVR